jgi:hypothetical protein
MIDLEHDLDGPAAELIAIGQWLEENMPNPPLPEPQRWTIGHSVDGRSGIRFSNDWDATIFSLRWKGQHD